MNIAFYGSSLLSSYWNGAATYYRGLIHALAQRGHALSFFEPDVYGRGERRDIEPPDWCRAHVYAPEPSALRAAAACARDADVAIVTSGIGHADEEVLQAVMAAARPDALRVFWDVDAPATLAAVGADAAHPLRRALGRLDLVLTYGGGEDVRRAYLALGARACAPIYNALDPATHFPVAPQARFACDLAFLGNRLPDREERVERFFLEPARAAPNLSFLLAGAGWGARALPPNVRWIDHLPTADHNAFNASARAVLNVNRADMARIGFSPPTRIFEAAGAGACIITDDWPGVARFLTPGEEILVVRDGRETLEQLRGLDARRAKSIGARARARVLCEHTYALRAQEAEAMFVNAFARKREAVA